MQRPLERQCLGTTPGKWRCRNAVGSNWLLVGTSATSKIRIKRVWFETIKDISPTKEMRKSQNQEYWKHSRTLSAITGGPYCLQDGAPETCEEWGLSKQQKSLMQATTPGKSPKQFHWVTPSAPSRSSYYRNGDWTHLGAQQPRLPLQKGCPHKAGIMELPNWTDDVLKSWNWTCTFFKLTKHFILQHLMLKNCKWQRGGLFKDHNFSWAD